MKTLVTILFAVIILFGTVTAQEKHGKPSDAEAMVKKAVAFYKANGQAKAFEEISNPKGKFVSGDIYVFVYDLTGKCVAHGGNPKMVGKDLIDLKDSDGKAFVKERLEIANGKGKGWQEYKFTNPVSKSIENKTAYIEKVDKFVVGSGAYSK